MTDQTPERGCVKAVRIKRRQAFQAALHLSVADYAAWTTTDTGQQQARDKCSYPARLLCGVCQMSAIVYNLLVLLHHWIRLHCKVVVAASWTC